MAQNNNRPLDPDLPIKSKDEDRLEFAPFAHAVAKQILAYDCPTSIVVGVSAPWGAGKTSLINLIVEEVEGLTHDTNPLVVFAYSPWIVGNRDALLADFLPQLANRLETAVPKKFRKERFKTAIKSLQRYARGVRGVESGLSVAAATATVLGIPVPAFLLPLAGLSGHLARLFRQEPSLAQSLDALRDVARDALKKAEINVLVVLDDLDRLEPAEVLDLIRMVRSTAELPYITYLLSFDHARVAESIERQLGVSGSDYLEKIVQLALHVPQASSFDLAQILGKRLTETFHDSANDEEEDREQSKRLSQSLWQDVRSVALRTPRDVSRISTSVSFAWQMLEGKVDPDDLFLTCVYQTKFPSIHNWMKQYSHAFHAETRGFNDDVRSEKFIERLKVACEAEEVSFSDVFETLQRILPALDAGMIRDEPKCFQGWSLDQAQSARRNKRLASEDHWLSYFDLSIERFMISESWVAKFFESAINNRSEAVTELVALAEVLIVSGGNEAERVLGRLRAEARGERLNPDQRLALFYLISDAADDLMASVGPPQFFQVSIFSQCAWLAQDLVRELPEQYRLDAVCNAMAEGRAASWLMYFLRDQMFLHGRVGDDTALRDRVLSDDQLDQLQEVGKARIDKLITENALLQASDPVYILLTWRDLVGKDDTKLASWVASTIASDEGFLAIVEAFSSIVRSSGGDYWRIQSDALADFLDIDAAVKRTNELSKVDSELGERAQELIRRFNADRET